MKRYKNKFKESSNYNLIGKIKDNNLINFYQDKGRGRPYQFSPFCWIKFNKPVFKNWNNKFSKINKTPCIFFEVDSQYDAVATYDGTNIRISFEYQGELVQRILRIERELDVEVTYI